MVTPKTREDMEKKSMIVNTHRGVQADTSTSRCLQVNSKRFFKLRA
jgi:hypothetical protein